MQSRGRYELNAVIVSINGALGHGDDLDRFEPEPVSTIFFEDDFVIAATQPNRQNLLLCQENTKIIAMKMGKTRIFNVHLAACGFKHTVVITTKGTAFSFGFGGSGRLGVGDEETKYRQKRIL